MLFTFSGCTPDDLVKSVFSPCATNTGQIQKAILVHLTDESGGKTKFQPNDQTTPTNPAIRDTWTPLFAATGKNKPVETPWLAEPVSEAGAAITYGGGNATPNGVTIILGREKQPFTAKILGQDQQKAIDTLKANSQAGSIGIAVLGVYLVNSAGKILMKSNGVESTEPTYELYPIPIHAFFVSDLTLGGAEAPDNNMISWEFPPNWSENLVIVDTQFSALEQLAPTS